MMEEAFHDVGTNLRNYGVSHPERSYRYVISLITVTVIMLTAVKSYLSMKI